MFWYRRNDIGVLSKVNTDKELSERNRKLIASAASEIQNPKNGIVYPMEFLGELCVPKQSSWENSVYKSKNRPHVLFLLTGMESENYCRHCNDLISELNAGGFDTGVITTNANPCQSVQKLRELTPNVFHMANFVELNDYAEFVSYYLISRQVDCIVVSGSRQGYMFLPWIREHFPDIVIVDVCDGQEMDCVPAVIEKTFRLETLHKFHFVSEVQRMIEDVYLRSQRHKMSEDLRSSSPISSVQYQQELQKNKMMAAFIPPKDTLYTKAFLILRENGIRGFASKLWKWIIRKIN